MRRQNAVFPEKKRYSSGITGSVTAESAAAGSSSRSENTSSPMTSVLTESSTSPFSTVNDMSTQEHMQ